MPKMPVMSGRELVKILERLGYVLVRQRGSHMVLRKGASGCVVPDHKELKAGTLAGILKQSGISMIDFWKNI